MGSLLKTYGILFAGVFSLVLICSLAVLWPQRTAMFTSGEQAITGIADSVYTEFAQLEKCLGYLRDENFGRYASCRPSRISFMNHARPIKIVALAKKGLALEQRLYRKNMFRIQHYQRVIDELGHDDIVQRMGPRDSLFIA